MPELDIQPELLSLRIKLADSIDEDGKQIDILTNRMNKNKELLHAINGSLGAIVSVSTGYGAVADMIRATIKSLPNNRFTSHDVDRQVLLNNPSASLGKDAIRTALWNMTKKHEIKQVVKGSNRNPAEYEKGDEMITRGRQVSEEGMDERIKRADAIRENEILNFKKDLSKNGEERPMKALA